MRQLELLCAECCIIQCSYVVDIDVHVPWAPDIEVRLPLTVKPPVDEVVSHILTV